MILFKEWGSEADKNTSFFRDTLSILRGVSEELASVTDQLNRETIFAFDLDSRLCRTRQWEWPWVLKQVYDHNRPGVQSGSKVLDIGCGFRPFTLLLNHLGLDVTAVDDMSWKAKEDLPALLGDRGVNFLKADASDLPFESGSFDYSFCISVIEHCDKKTIDKIISEGRRVTKSDGLFIVTMDGNSKVNFLLPDGPVPPDVVATLSGIPVAGVVFSGNGG